MSKVKMTNAEVTGLVDVLNDVTKKNVSLSAKSWYGLTKSRKALIDEAKNIEDARLKLVEKYGKKEKGILVGVDEKHQDAFRNDYMELMGIETEVTLHKISIDELSKSEESIQGLTNIFLMFEYLVKEEDN
jgi:uncharacterized protein YnzC (UPF0291/DUF896 family)